MTSLLARLGHSFDTRRAAQTFLSTAGKRKRGTQWVCAECRGRRTGRVQQHRGYNDGGIRLGAEEHLFSQQENEMDSRGGNERGAWSLKRHRNAEQIDESAKYEAIGTEPEAMAGSDPGQEFEGLWEHSETVQENEDLQREEVSATLGASVQDEYEVKPIQDQSLLELDYKTTLSGALLRAETDLVMRCLFAAAHANDIDFIRGIPATSFSEIIRLAEPRRFVSKLGSTHLELSSMMVKKMHTAPMRQIAFEYTSVIRQMLGIRKSAGMRLTFGDYTILLRAARDLGNPRMGRLLWTNMLEEGYKPNTLCYNYMMSTIVWNGVHLAGARQKVRIVPFNMLGRSKQNPTSRFHNYRVGPSGVRLTATSIFSEMLANDAYADESSFRILMTASAREGDLDTVKSILMKVWNIDVDGIMAGKPESSILPKQRPDHSPLRPTKDLLFTLAHIFGINNDIPTALRVVDFAARHYNLELNEHAWSQLFEWTFVLAMDRPNVARRKGTDAGILPPRSLLNLWDTMISPPYNLNPTMGMYNFIIKHMFRNRWVPEMTQKMSEARWLYHKHRNRADQAYNEWRDAIERLGSAKHLHSSGKTVEKLRNQYEHADLIRQRDLFWLKRWVRLYLGVHRHHHRLDHMMDSCVRRVPRLLFDWRHAAPTKVKYETQTGMVEIVFRTEEEVLDNSRIGYSQRLERQKLLDACGKLVGQAWVRGGEVKKTRRMVEHEHKREQEEQLDAE